MARKEKLITHSAWTGKKYDKPRTVDEVAAESMAILARRNGGKPLYLDPKYR